MSFVKLPNQFTAEALLEEASKPGSLWVPTALFTYVNETGSVGLVRKASDTRLFMPRGTLDLNMRASDVPTIVSDLAIRRAIATFGPGNEVSEDDIQIAQFGARIEKPIKGPERVRWRNAVGALFIPAVVPIDTRNCDGEDEWRGSKIITWEKPEKALKLLVDEVAEFGEDAVISEVSADALRVSIPLIPSVLASIS
jgi:hypothetical protein